MDEEYDTISTIFEEQLSSFESRKEKIASTTFSEVNWSDSYLDFIPYSSAINQLKPPTISSKEKSTSAIKNFFLNGKLLHSVRIENENWGSVFVEYEKDSVKWLLFSEDFDDKMVLQQLKIAHYQNDQITKVVSYLSDKDADEETLMVDIYHYNKENKLESIIRNGFYEMKSTILDEREISFVYENGIVSIYSTQNTINNKQLIYEGDEL